MKMVVHGAAALLMMAAVSAAQASLIDVYQSGSKLGTIDSYSGTLSAVDNYGYVSPKNNLHNGPTLSDSSGHIFFYEGSDGLSFNTIFGSSGDATRASVHWDITITGSTTDPSVLIADDGHELSEVGTSNVFDANWVYVNNLGDGGSIGALSGDNWQIEIDPSLYDGVILGLTAYGATAGALALDINTIDNIIFKAAASVPVPGTLALLMLGLAGLSLRKKVTA